MFLLSTYIKHFTEHYPELAEVEPWKITSEAIAIVTRKIATLGNEYSIREGIAIHQNARIEEHVILKSPLIISEDCFIGAHAYLRGGVFLGKGVSIGPGCEIKSSFILSHSALAHFNFVGDSLIGRHVNMEAGAVIANHFNERENKLIEVLNKGERYVTGVTKFGALIGDGAKIGANAVLSPGTLLLPNAIVKRLELVEQVHYIE